MVEKVQAKIVSMSRFNDTIWQYVLEPEHFVPYQAGQYLQIHSAEGDHYYSIANAPAQGRYYELHVRHRAATQVWSDQHSLELSLPYGVCDLSHLHVYKPILFLAVGAGIHHCRGNNGQTTTFFNITRSTIQALRSLQRIRVNPPSQYLT